MTANGCGVHARWTAGCPACQRVSRAYERKRRAAIQAGTWKPQVPAEQVKAHVESLVASGANVGGIAAAANLPVRTVQGLRYRQWVQGETAAAIFAVQNATARLKEGQLPPAGACRRVQALAALGWSLTEQGRRLGWPVQRVWQIAKGKPGSITEATDRLIRDLFEELSSTPGPSKRARNHAAREGWLPPLAWDDIDDPGATPSLGEGESDVVDEIAMERALAGERIILTDAELVQVLQAGVARGETLSKLAERLGVSHVGAKKLVGGELTPRRAKRAAIEAEVRRCPDAADWTIAALLGVHHTTVRRARERIAAGSVAA